MDENYSNNVLHPSNMAADIGKGIDITNMPKEQCDVAEWRKAQGDENAVLFDSDIFPLDQLESKLAVGKIVKSVDDAYLLYCSYAHAKGFSVRKGDQRYRGQSSELKWKEFKCSCDGKKNESSSENRVAVYRKLSTRTNCKAMLKIARDSGGEWKVSRFEKEHNHEMLGSHKTHLLRSSRKIFQAKTLFPETRVNARITDVPFVEKEAQGPQHSAFHIKGADDHLDCLKRHVDVESSDARALVQYFINKSAQEPSFYWNVQVDDDRVLNFFFRDYRCLVDYEYFRDVVSIDIVHRTKKCNLVCAAFVGINHHKQNLMFGLAFMSDETESSFEWLFNTFLDSMNGKQPETIFSDQCETMTNAIEMAFPEAHQCLYQWHKNQDAPLYLGDIIYDEVFEQLWDKCMCECDSEEEFEITWKDMIEKYDLSGNEWLNNMHKIRHKWATAFSNDKFTAGLLGTSRIPSTNLAMKKAGSRATTLFDFVHNFEKIINSWRTAESYEDARCLKGKPSPIVKNNTFLTQVSDIYTLNVYKMFESEFLEMINTGFVGDLFSCVDRFELKSHVDSSSIKQVVFDKRNGVINCSCHKFETLGILCKHALSVFSINCVNVLPERYIKRRWMRDAKNRVHSDRCSASSDSLVIADEYSKIDDFLIHDSQHSKTRKITSSQMVHSYDKSKTGKGKVKVYCSKAKATKRKGPCSQDCGNIRVGVSSHPSQVCSLGCEDRFWY